MAEHQPTARFRRSRSVALGVAALAVLGGSACGTRVESRRVAPVAQSANDPHASIPDAGIAPAVTSSGGGVPASSSAPAPAASSGVGSPAAKATAKDGAAQRPDASAGPDEKPAAASPGRSTTPGVAKPATPGATTPTAPSAALGATITLGTVGTMSGPVGGAFGGVIQALQIWVRQINAAGGLRGHPIKYITGDDGGDPARHKALLQEFVERKGVAAFVGNLVAIAGRSGVSYLEGKRVPVIGTDTSSTWIYDSPMFFPQAGSGAALFELNMLVARETAVPAGKAKLATLVCVETPTCGDADKLWNEQGYAKKAGLEPVWRGKASIAQPDYTAECLNARQAGAQLLTVLMDYASTNRVFAACARQGFRPTPLLAAGAADARQKGNRDLDGAIVGFPMYPWFLRSLPAAADFGSAMDRYLGGAPIGHFHMLGWGAAKLFELAAGRSPDPTTSAGLLEGLWTVNGEDLGGLTQPLTFTRDRPAPRTVCWFTAVMKDGEFTSPDGGKRRCL